MSAQSEMRSVGGGTKRKPSSVVSQAARAMSQLMERWKLGWLAGFQFGGKRDLYGVYGYDQYPTPEQFMIRYQRQDIASRVIDAPPDATWSAPPEFTSSSRNKSWLEKNQQPLNIWTAMHRVDRLARLGHYAGLMLGFDDGQAPDKPVKEAKNLVYLRAFGECRLRIDELDGDPKSPNFGKPVMYTVRTDPTKPIVAKGQQIVKDFTVHASRIIHVVENPLEDDIYSTPTIEKVYNLLDDLAKVVGGTAETYWLTSNRGIQADVDKEMELDPADAADLKDMIEEYQHQLTRIIRTRGVKINQIGSETPQPKDTFEMLIALISGTTGIPQRILIGSEAGQLASTQDRANWAERITDRRALFAEPYLLNPFIKKLTAVGIMNEGNFSWEWPEAFRVSPLEESQTMAATARAVGNLSRQTGNSVPMQITSVEEARAIVKLDGPLPKDGKEPTQGDLEQQKLDQSAKNAQAQADAAAAAAQNPQPPPAVPGAPPAPPVPAN